MDRTTEQELVTDERITNMLRRLRALAYRHGHRPRPGTLLYSPSLDLQATGHDISDAIQRGINRTADRCPDHDGPRCELHCPNA